MARRGGRDTTPADPRRGASAAPEQSRRRADSASLSRLARLDGWSNVLTGMGIDGKDWTRATQVDADTVLQQADIDALYQADPLARRICDLRGEHATRRWIGLSGVDGGDDGDSPFETEAMDKLESLESPEKFAEALRLNSKDGGSIILLGVDDGKQLSEPLDLGSVRALNALHVVERWAWIPGQIDTDARSPNFGRPLHYLLNTVVLQAAASGGFATGKQPRSGAELAASRAAEALSAKAAQQAQAKPSTAADPLTAATQAGEAVLAVHHTRLIVFDGISVSRQVRRENFGWGLSELQYVKPALQRYRELWGHLGHLFKILSQRVVKMPGLAKMIAEDKGKQLVSRLELINLVGSTLKMIPIGADEEITNLAAELSGVGDLLLRCQDDIAAASGYPLTLLFGHSPAGFSSDDEPGMRNFYDLIAQFQRRMLRRPINRILEILIAANAVSGAPDRWQINFLPLLEPTDDEISKRRYQDAQTAQLYYTIGAVDAQEIRDGLRADPLNPFPLLDDAARPVEEPATPPPAPGDPNADPAADPLKPKTAPNEKPQPGAK